MARSLPVAPDVRVAVACLAGAVRIVAWDRQEVRVEGRLGRDIEGLELTGGGGSARVEVQVPARRELTGLDVAAEITVRVPGASRVAVKTMTASIEVEGVSARLETVTGSIRLDGRDSAVTARSKAGDVVLRGVAGELEVSTVSGDVEVAGGRIERGTIESMAGAITVAAALAPGGRLRVVSHSGAVAATLPAETSARFEIDSFSGDVATAPETSQARPEGPPGPGRRRAFSTGNGDGSVSIRTFSGDVRLRCR